MNMSLPVAQQHTLDTIANGLRRSAPKLAAKYAIFSRLCSAEALPRREQLDTSRGWRDCWSRSSRQRATRGLRSSPWALIALLASQVAVAFVLLAVVLGVGWHGSTGCASPSHHATTDSVQLWCAAATTPGGLPGK
jgi:hypothetical protein